MTETTSEKAVPDLGARAVAHRESASPLVLIKGAGEMASAVAWRLAMANIRRICMSELDAPLCVRRTVSFSTAIEREIVIVEGVEACVARDRAAIECAWSDGRIAVVPQSHWSALGGLSPSVVVDAILAKRNTGTALADAPLVIALGPGFVAGRDCHFVIETNRGHDLGRIITAGSAQPNTGVPGEIAGHTAARVLRAGADGVFRSERSIGDRVEAGEVVGTVAGTPVAAGVGGILRGLICSGTPVSRGLKLGDVDPRAKAAYCWTISDKARAIAGSVLEAIMRRHSFW
ncbi:MAG: selenium-dependent molybdenum cofactor biosynthesis protein YqeB [Xanthobacteraceae bacterium]